MSVSTDLGLARLMPEHRQTQPGSLSSDTVCCRLEVDRYMTEEDSDTKTEALQDRKTGREWAGSHSVTYESTITP